MTKRVEINMNESDRDAAAARKLPLNELCKRMHLRWQSYKECFNCHNVESLCNCNKEKRDLKVVYFIAQEGFTTGVRYNQKLVMSEDVTAFLAVRLTDRNAELVPWAGARGRRIMTTMNEEGRKAVQARKEAMRKMQEAVEQGEMANVDAGVASLKEVVL